MWGHTKKRVFWPIAAPYFTLYITPQNVAKPWALETLDPAP